MASGGQADRSLGLDAYNGLYRATNAGPELVNLPAQRLSHLREHLAAAEVQLAVLTNPVSIRYATGYSGYAMFQSHIPSAYLLLPNKGPVILHGAYTDQLDTIDECQVARSVTAFDAGLDAATAAERFVSDVVSAIKAAGLTTDATVGVERVTPSTMGAFHRRGLRVVDAEPTVELARSRKLPAEMVALDFAIEVAELGMKRMEDALTAGASENELFALLHQTNIAHGGDWIDGRMLCSGFRTNPWYQEASARKIQHGDLVAFDTDMIGPNGYCADISRTWVCDSDPTASQRDLYDRAVAEIEHNTAQLHVGASFAELSQASFRQPDRFVPNRYACIYHGVGMSDEYPKIAYPDDWHWTGYDGEIETGLVLSVESYVGEEGGTQGVKLEQMVQVTDDGVVALSTYPLWDYR